MRVLITGGTGHLGPGVCRKFLSDGFRLRLLVHKSPGEKLGPDVEFLQGDITRPESIQRAIQGVDVVVHMAAVVEPVSEELPALAASVNVDGTRILLDAIKHAERPIPFVFISSVAVFGPTPEPGACLHADRSPCRPASVYAESKLRAERVIAESGIDYAILRLTATPYSKVSRDAISRQMFMVPLENRIEFCHPDDAALAILNSVKRFQAVKGRILIVGGGSSQQMYYRDMVGAMLKAFGLPLPPAEKFSREPFALDWYDTRESQALLEFQQKTLDDYTRDLGRQLPAPVSALMRHIIGPVFGRAIARLL